MPRPASRPLTVHKFGGTSLGSAERIEAAVQILRHATREGRVAAVVSATSGTTNVLLEAAEEARAGRGARWRAALESIRHRHVALAEQFGSTEVKRGVGANIGAGARDSYGTNRPRPSLGASPWPVSAAASGRGGSGAASGRGGSRAASHRHASGVSPGRTPSPAATSASEVHRLCDELEAALHGVSLLHELSDRSRDSIASFGELLSAPIVAAALTRSGLRAAAVDARRLIVTDARHGRATADLAATRRAARLGLLPLLARGVLPVITGFIARGPHGVTTTLGRSGSDTTAAIIAASLGARRIVIWTDVDGFLSADPRLVSRPHLLSRLTYREASELTYFGAKVLHFPAMIPAIAHGIPILIRNSFRPSVAGTLIDARGPGRAHGIAAITAIRGLATVSLEGKGMVGVPGIAARAFSAVARERVSVLMFSQASSEQNICMVVPEEDRTPSLRALREEFAAEITRGNLDGVQAHGPVAAVAAVGEGMRGTRGVAALVFSAVARAGINIEAIAQGSSEVNISFIVEDRDAPRAVGAVHRLCLEKRGRTAP